MNPKLILFALVLSGVLSGCSSPTEPTSPDKTVSFENTFKKVEHQVPELESISTSGGIPGSGQVWRGEEYATANFALRGHIRYHPTGEFPRETNPVPYTDMSVTITRYASSQHEQNEFENTFRLRQATFRPKEKYKGAVLYRYQGTSKGVLSAICQSGPYIIEISANTEPASFLTMKVLDAMLSGIDNNALR
jgi:hypothetical protein